MCVRTTTPALFRELYALAHTIQRNDGYRGEEKQVSEHFRTERARIKCQMLRNMTSAVIPRTFILRAKLACVERASTANVSTTG